jgi:hypothetical protein
VKFEPAFFRGVFLFYLSLVKIFSIDFAVVDPTVLFLLHPDLRNFNFLNLRFERDPAPVKGQTLSQWRKQRSRVLSQLSQNLYDLRENRRRSLSKLNRHLLKLRQNRPLGYQKRMSEEARLWKKANQDQEAQLLEVTKHYYYSRSETQRRLKGIMDQVYEVLKTGPTPPQRLFFTNLVSHYHRPEVAATAMDQAPLLAFRRSYFRFLQGKIFGAQPREHGSQLREYFTHYQAIRPLFAPFFSQRPVVLGAEDQTGLYLRKLYEFREIPEPKIAQILDVYKFWKEDYLGDELRIYSEDTGKTNAGHL